MPANPDWLLAVWELCVVIVYIFQCYRSRRTTTWASWWRYSSQKLTLSHCEWVFWRGEGCLRKQDAQCLLRGKSSSSDSCIISRNITAYRGKNWWLWIPSIREAGGDQPERLFYIYFFLLTFFGLFKFFICHNIFTMFTQVNKFTCGEKRRMNLEIFLLSKKRKEA